MGKQTVAAVAVSTTAYGLMRGGCPTLVLPLKIGPSLEIA